MDRDKTIYDDCFSNLLTHCFCVNGPRGILEAMNSRYISSVTVMGTILTIYDPQLDSCQYHFSTHEKARDAWAVIVASFPTHFLPDDKD